MSETGQISLKKKDSLAKLGTRMPYEEAERTYEELTGQRTSKTQAHRVVQAMGKKALAQGIRHKRLKGNGKTHVGADGVMINIRKEGWKEMKIPAGPVL